MSSFNMLFRSKSLVLWIRASTHYYYPVCAFSRREAIHIGHSHIWEHYIYNTEDKLNN
jgi:hypothetical protein